MYAIYYCILYAIFLYYYVCDILLYDIITDFMILLRGSPAAVSAPAFRLDGAKKHYNLNTINSYFMYNIRVPLLRAVPIL